MRTVRVAYNPHAERNLEELMRTLTTIAAVLYVSAAAGAGQPPARTDVLILRNANVVDVRSGRVTAMTTIRIVNDRIESIGAASGPIGGVKVLDLKGKYVVPGLIDAHT